MSGHSLFMYSFNTNTILVSTIGNKIERCWTSSTGQQNTIHKHQRDYPLSPPKSLEGLRAMEALRNRPGALDGVWGATTCAEPDRAPRVVAARSPGSGPSIAPASLFHPTGAITAELRVEKREAASLHEHEWHRHPSAPRAPPSRELSTTARASTIVVPRRWSEDLPVGAFRWRGIDYWSLSR